MTRRFLLLAFVAPLSIAPASVVAEPLVYVCDIDVGRSGAFQPQLVIAHDAAERFVSVNDALIQGVNGGPLLGDVATENNTRIVFKWTLLNVKDGSGQLASLAYRATIFKSDGKLNISMRPLNFDNSFTARGTCKTE